jgi:hypothetical protein
MKALKDYHQMINLLLDEELRANNVPGTSPNRSKHRLCALSKTR